MSGVSAPPCIAFSARTTLAEAARCLARCEQDLGVELVRCDGWRAESGAEACVAERGARPCCGRSRCSGRSARKVPQMLGGGLCEVCAVRRRGGRAAATAGGCAAADEPGLPTLRRRGERALPGMRGLWAVPAWLGATQTRERLHKLS